MHVRRAPFDPIHFVQLKREGQPFLVTVLASLGFSPLTYLLSGKKT